MRDVRLIALAGRQHNRLSRDQASALGVTDDALALRLAQGRLIREHDAVFSFGPSRPDDRGRWMGATLSAPSTVLSHASAAAAHGFWSFDRDIETVTRPGSGGPRRLDGLLVFRSATLDPWTTERWGIPLTSPERTVIDLAPHISRRALARCVREAVRLRRASVAGLVEAAQAHRGRRGITALRAVLAAYAELPLERARSGAEVAALELLREHERLMAALNRRIAGEEADLSWAAHRLIIEIDGGPYHLDRGEDARKERIWRAAGWEVRRVDSADVYDAPHRFLALVPSGASSRASNVRQSGL